MTTINTSDEELLAMEVAFTALTNKFAEEGHSPFAAAAIMAKLSFMIYKSSLNAEDYNLMIDAISDNRDKVLTFSELASIGRLN